MRLTHARLLLSVLMFVASIWFVLAGLQPGAAAAAGAPTEPVATVKQLMDGIIAPASSTVYQSVSIVVTVEGEQENYPRTQAEWDAVSGAAAALAEAGGLLMVEGRRRDDVLWTQHSQAMIAAALVSMKAAQNRDKEALLASGEALNASCDSCHRSYDVDE